MHPVDSYFLKQTEPAQTLMLRCRQLILECSPKIEERLSYGIPFYYYKSKPLLYLNKLKGTDFVDLAFMRGIDLENDFFQLSDYKNRKQVRSLQLEYNQELDEDLVQQIILKAIALID